MGNLKTRFADWVDSFGSRAGDHMVTGALTAAIVAGCVCLGVAVVLESPVMLGVGFVAVVGHIFYMMAAM